MTYITHITYIHNSYYLHVLYFKVYSSEAYKKILFIIFFPIYIEMVNKYYKKHKERFQKEEHER